MPFIDIDELVVSERLPGWSGRYFHSPSMTFAHYDFVRGSAIHDHFHPQEEAYEVIEGERELTIDGVTQIARPGTVGIVPSNVRHTVKALSDGRATIVDCPLRRDFQWAASTTTGRQFLSAANELLHSVQKSPSLRVPKTDTSRPRRSAMI